MTISAKEVQELRKISGAGMMECKTALSESKGDLNEAFKLLREKGIAKAEKKSGRDANEGLIGIKVHSNKASIIELNSETDFVSRNSEFHELVNQILDISVKSNDPALENNQDVSDLINSAVGKIGENIVLRRYAILNGNIHSYVHNAVSNGLGKIGVIVDIDTDTDVSDLSEVGKNICMHIAALNPKSISENDLDNQLIDAEKDIIRQQLKDTGKPENILEKMMDGKLKKFFDENTLLGQKFVVDPSITVQQYIDKASEKNKSKISIKKFIRYEIGS